MASGGKGHVCEGRAPGGGGLVLPRYSLPRGKKAVYSRLESGEMIGTARSRANFGKLMELLLVFMDKR